jgi:hypothetical protein
MILGKTMATDPSVHIHRTARTKMSGQGWHDMTAGIRQPGQDPTKDSQNRSEQARTGKEELEVRTEQAEQDRQNKTARIGPPGLPEHDC